jgi:hypothetical protein
MDTFAARRLHAMPDNTGHSVAVGLLAAALVPAGAPRFAP